MKKITLNRPPPRMAMNVMATRMKGSASCVGKRITIMSQKPR